MKFADVADYREHARRRLPRFVFDFIDGGAGTEAGLARNVKAFDNVLLRPRYLVDIEKRSLRTKFLGREWTAPFGVAPMGLANLAWPGTDHAIALAVKSAGLPCVAATAASTTLERMRELAGDNAWFMLYPGRSEPVVADLIERAAAAGYDVMVVTVDVPLASWRTREIRNNFTTPYKLTPAVMLDLASHPAWSIAMARAGAPGAANMAKYTSGPASEQAAYMASQTIGRFDWDGLKAVRARWRGKLIVKGLLTREDAVRAQGLGCDGIAVSNHGGRQLASLPAPIEVLPEIRDAVGPAYPVLMDGGVRCGEDIVKALALGADFVLVGRAILYAAGALGAAGPAAAIALLKAQADRCLGQIGLTDVPSLKAASPAKVETCFN